MPGTEEPYTTAMTTAQPASAAMATASPLDSPKTDSEAADTEPNPNPNPSNALFPVSPNGFVVCLLRFAGDSGGAFMGSIFGYGSTAMQMLLMVRCYLTELMENVEQYWQAYFKRGEVQYFIGVPLDGSQHIEPLHNSIPEVTVKESEKLVKETAVNVDEAARELPYANMKPEDLWMNHSKVVHPKPHRRDSPPWRAIQKILDSGEQIGLKHFKPIKPLGSGDTGSVHLVQLCGTDQYYP